MAKKAFTYLVILFVSFVYAATFHIFIFPNNFAPSGLNGICTMVQYLFHFNLGYLNLLLNVPLVIAVFFLVGKPQALRAGFFTVAFSVFVLLLEKVDLTPFIYYTENGTSRILGPIVGGLIASVGLTVLAKANACGGGTEFIALLVNRFHPQLNFYWFAFALNALVAVLSYFVYGYQIEPVILSVLYCFSSSIVRAQVMENSTRAVRCEIVTPYPEDLAKDISDKLRHTATLLPGKGYYSGKEVSVLVCIINKTQVESLKSVVKTHPGCFVSLSRVDAVWGNFSRLDSHGNPEKEFVDAGK